MAFTKVVGPGIHTLSNIASHNINSSGIITATQFDGPFSNVVVGGATTLTVDGINISAGILTAQTLDLNGNGDISGNLVVGGNFTANGDFTTLNTTLREVELLRVDANNDSAIAGIITQSGSGHALYVDGTTILGNSQYVPTFLAATKLAVANLSGNSNSVDMTILGGRAGKSIIRFGDHDSNNRGSIQYHHTDESINFYNNGNTTTPRLTIASDGNIGINSTVPTTTLDVRGTVQVSGISTFADVITASKGITVNADSTGGTDNVISVGESGDLKMYHQTGVSYLRNTNSGGFTIKSNTFRIKGVNGSLTALETLANGAVDLYFNNQLRLATTAQGINVSRVGGVSQIGISQTTTTAYSINGTISFINSSNTTAQIQGRTGAASTTGDILFLCNTVGDESLAILEDGKVRVPDRGSFVAGTGNDLTIYHNSSNNNSYIAETGSGDLLIQGTQIKLQDASGTDYIRAFTGGSVYLHNAGNSKFETTSTGVHVTGEVSASQDYPDLRPTLDFNFAAVKKLDPRIKYYRTGPASYVNEFGRVVLVGDNEPRFDHGYKYESSHGYSLARDKCQGLLLEMTRENLVKQSIYKSDGTTHTTGTVNDWGLLYTGGGTGSLTPGIDAPDGSKDAVRWTNNNTGHALLRLSIDSFTPNGSDTYVISFYVRGVSGTGNLNCDLADGLPSGDWSIHMVTNEWRRIIVTGVPSNASKTFLDIVSNVNNNRVFDIWGVQLEKGTYATSFIPTFGVKTTRGYEHLVIDGKDFTDFYNPLESSVLAVGRLQRPAAAQGQLNILHIGDDNEDGHGIFREHGTKDVWYHIRNNNSTPSGGNLNPNGFGDWDAEEEARIAAAFKDGDQAISVNGGNQITATVTSSYPTANITKMWIGSHGNGSYFEGTISRIAYYPKKLTDNQLNTLTAS